MKQPQARPALMTTSEAAKYLRLGVSTLERHRGLGTGPKFVHLGNKRSVRYRLADLEAWCRPVTSTSEYEA